MRQVARVMGQRIPNKNILAISQPTKVVPKDVNVDDGFASTMQ